MRTLRGTVFALACAIAAIRDAPAEDDTLTVVGPGWTNVAGPYVVGDSGTNNRLRIVEGGVLTNEAGTLGNLASAAGNSATVAGPGSQWVCTDHLFVGRDGSANSLVASNGGQAFTGRESDGSATGDGHIGYGAAATGNVVRVTGSNSAWTIVNNLHVGYAAGGNRIELADGGRMVCGITYGAGIASVGFEETSGGNSVLVAGPGSSWEPRRTRVGFAGSGCAMIVSNGASCRGVLDIGSGTQAASNTVRIHGAGSQWNPASDVTIGVGGSGNGLVLEAGASVGGNSIHLGYEATSSNNTGVVSGSGTVWECTGQVVVGYHGAGNALTVGNGARLAVRLSTVLGIHSLSGPCNTARVSGAGSVWTNGEDFLVGQGSTGNVLTVEDGGALFDGTGRIGATETSAGNRVLVTGAGTRWINREDVEVGFRGSSNTLTIALGGLVAGRNGILGAEVPGSNNTAIISGSGSRWTNTADVVVGPHSAGNRLLISSGGRVDGASGGVRAGGNSAVVTDSNSTWACGGGLEIAGTLVVSNGGTVANGPGWIDAQGSAAVVTGPGSFWSNSAALTIAQTGNSLAVLDGGTVLATSIVISPDAGDASNTVLVSGGSLIATDAGGTGELVIGRDGAGRLVLAGGTLVADRLVLTNPASALVFESGTIATRGARIDHGHPIVLGEGAALRFEAGTNLLADAVIVPAGARVAVAAGAVADFAGPVTNNGVIDAILGTADFHAGVTGTGVVLRAVGDADGDGMPNLDEALAGTDPLDRTSLLLLTGMTAESGGLRIDWRAGAGHTNSIEAAVEPAGPYTQVGPAVFVPGAGTVDTNSLDAAPSGPSARYYRVRVRP